MGGMIGGAILGALVNKIQGKDWKRGALFGGITGGVMGAPGMSGVLGKMKPGLMKNLLTTGTQYGGTAAWSPLAKYGIPAAVTYFAGDPESDRKKQEEFMASQSEAQKKKNIEMYPDWYKNFWPGFFNKGGIINARPGYYNGGSATLDYTDPDLYTPTGEGGGPSSNPIMQLPLGPEGSFTDEFDELDLSGLNDSERSELQSLMSLRLITPKDDPKYPQIEMRIQELMEGISAQTGRSIGPAGASTVSDDGTRMMEMAAQGGSIKRPGYFLGGATKGLAQLFASGKAGDMAEEMYKDEELEGVYDRNLEQVKDFIGDEEGFDYRSLMLGPPRGEDTGASGDSNKKLRMILNALRATTPMAQGGHINRPGYKFGGGIDWSKVQSAMNNAGQFGGPEKVWQAKNVASTDPGVYQKGWFGGSGLTSGGENVNQAVKDWQSWRKGRIGSAYGNSDAQHIYRDNYLGNFANKYPGAAGLGMTGMDVFNQQLLEEEAPEGYAYAQGGIADLDMRGGGHSIGPGTGTSDDVPAMLSDGEFVMTANAVKNLGGGDRMVGAKRMYNMMNSLDPNSQTPGEMNTVGYG